LDFGNHGHGLMPRGLMSWAYSARRAGLVSDLEMGKGGGVFPPACGGIKAEAPLGASLT